MSKRMLSTYLTFPAMPEPGFAGGSLPLLLDLPPAILCFCTHKKASTITPNTHIHTRANTHTHTHTHTSHVHC